MQLKLVLRIFVILSSWLLMLLDNYAWYVGEVLAVVCIFAVMHWSNPMLPPYQVWNFWTCARAAFFSCCSCCNWACRLWNSALLAVGLWLWTGALPSQHSGWNCSSTLWITASELLSVDRVAATDESERGSSNTSPCCRASCHPSKWKADSVRL